MPIPKIIHQLWISPINAPIPDDICKNIHSWEKTHPDFIRITWSMQRLECMLEDFYGLNVLEHIMHCRFPAMQADLIRLALVYEFGGFWSDLKNYVLTPFVYDLLQYDIPVLTQHWPTDNPDNPDPHLSNSFFGAPIQNQYIGKCLEMACENIEKRVKKGVFGLTGGGLMTNVINHDQDGKIFNTYHLQLHNAIWGVTIKRRGGSYNNGNQHWSIRQKNESYFI